MNNHIIIHYAGCLFQVDHTSAHEIKAYIPSSESVLNQITVVTFHPKYFVKQIVSFNVNVLIRFVTSYNF